MEFIGQRHGEDAYRTFERYARPVLMMGTLWTTRSTLFHGRTLSHESTGCAHTALQTISDSTNERTNRMRSTLATSFFGKRTETSDENTNEPISLQ